MPEFDARDEKNGRKERSGGSTPQARSAWKEATSMSVRVARAMGEIRDLFTLGAIGTWTDGQLIGHYLSGEADSENAFRVLIYRHGPMVLRV